MDLNCRIANMCLIAGLLGAGCSVDDQRSDTTQSRGAALSNRKPLPSMALTKVSRPTLNGTSSQAKSNVRAFVSWAAGSRSEDREEARAAIHEASNNVEVAQSLADEALSAQVNDHSRALIALGLLGEMRSPQGVRHLTRFLWQPLPTTGTIVEGEIVEQTGMATLEAKAVNGLAYLRSPEGDAEVLRAAGQHPSVIVRAEAIASYLWNHGGTAEARAELAKNIRPEEAIFMDRVRREPGERSASFDKKVVAFLQDHPDRVPPPPVHSAPHAPKGDDADVPRATNPPAHR